MDQAVPEIDVDELARLLDGGVNLIDVRQPDEYVDQHVPGASLIPLAEVPDRLAEVPEGTVAVICKSGSRSLRASEFLRANGVDAVNVAGGTDGWVASGRDTAAGEQPS
jgi:thioredoxin 1